MTKQELIEMYEEHLDEVRDQLQQEGGYAERDSMENEISLVENFIQRLKELE